MNNGLTLEGLIQLQEEQGMSDEKFYEMVTDKVCEDPSIEKGLLEYEDVYKVIKGIIKKTKSYSLKPRNFIKEMDKEFWQTKK